MDAAAAPTVVRPSVVALCPPQSHLSTAGALCICVSESNSMSFPDRRPDCWTVAHYNFQTCWGQLPRPLLQTADVKNMLKHTHTHTHWTHHECVRWTHAVESTVKSSKLFLDGFIQEEVNVESNELWQKERFHQCSSCFHVSWLNYTIISPGMFRFFCAIAGSGAGDQAFKGSALWDLFIKHLFH